MKFADRLNRLGGETAFAVGAEAGALAREGKKIYPFHLGDLNITTPQNIIDAAYKAMNDGKTGYCPTGGILELREALAQDVGKARGIDYTPDSVSVQPGGKPIIGKFMQVVMNEGDEVLYPNPGYPIYESQITYFGGVPKPYRLMETDAGFVIDMDDLISNITPKTCAIVYNNFHNPLGAKSTDEEMKQLADLCIKNDLYVLSDEAYFDILYEGTGKSIASLPGMEERTLILYTFSKKYAMTGWRLGAGIGPADLIKHISTLNVNAESCTTHFIQWAGVEALTGPQEPSKAIIEELRGRLDTAYDALTAIPGVKVHKPDCTFYLFPNVTGAMKMMNISDVEEFRKIMLKETGVSFTTRKHFGTPYPGETEQYIRLAYSGINSDQIEEGLGKMKDILEDFVR